MPVRPDDRIHSIAILGGGAAGWLAAATLARVIQPGFCTIRLLELSRANASAISESTLPSFHRLNALLGIDEADLVRKTQGTFRLGAEFTNWARAGDRYFHTFGSIGARLAAVPFHQYWLRLFFQGPSRPAIEGLRIEDFSIASSAAAQGRFALPATDPRSVLSHYSYGYHFHAGLLAEYLREYAEAHGATRMARDVIDVRLRGSDGFIDALLLNDGTTLRADLYIDCTGAPGGLFAQALEKRFVDWSQWLPCDRAVSILCEGGDEIPPFSRSIACASGWQWQVPLRQSVDCGYAYPSHLLRDDEASEVLRRDLPGRALGEPRILRFTRGRPSEFWSRNYLVIAGGAMEPLEATALHLVQTGIARLLALFPVRGFSADDVDEYNRLSILEHERVRDLLILHHWSSCREMEIPDTLRAKIELFRSSGRISLLDEEHFNEDSWLTVLLGQGVEPEAYDPLADVLPVADVQKAFAQAAAAIRAAVASMPPHRKFLEEYCAR